MLNIDYQDGVTVIELEHGPVNAFDVDLSEAVIEAFAEVRGPVVLTGAGRSFSAGVDLAQIVDGGGDYVDRFLRALSRSLLVVFRHPAPTVAAVNGHAVAGGCVLALACDARLMAAGRIGLSEVAVGVSFPPAALEIVRHALGSSLGRLVLRADLVDPSEARRLGLVDDVVDQDELRQEAVRLAAALGGHPARAYAETKAALQRPALEAIEAGDEDAVIAMWSSPETMERLGAQLQALRSRA